MIGKPLSLVLLAAAASASDRPVNIVFLMSDELAYYELSHMGNPYIRTPRIDRMAAEGLRMTHALASAPVCAPLRCALMTGKHMGHASVRANDGGTALRADEVTLASLLKERGYATGGFGKWGAGGRGSTGVPEQHGFDVFYGYYDQVHAHSFYPEYLVRNSEEVPLEGNIGGRSGKSYSHYAIFDAGLEFIRENRERPFFCYLPITPPHGMYDIPADDPAWDLYREDAWMQDEALDQDVKNYAAMVSMVDRDLGRVLDLLGELGLEQDTLVFFTGDNGGQDRFQSKQHPRGFFGPNVDPVTGVEFRGGKGNLYEGGLRIPFLVRWPGRIEPGRVSDLRFAQTDVLPTLTELAGARTPEDVDGISILPELLGAAAVGREQSTHPFLYWEFGSQVAVRAGDWKAIRPGKDEAWALYDLARDPSERADKAAAHPERLAELRAIAGAEHEPARPGTYTSRLLHERDRQAKWGATPPPRGKAKIHRLDPQGLVPFDEVRVLRVSSENASNGKVAANAVDGDPTTVWHTRWSDGVVEHPHELVLDLGSPHRILGLRYLARQDDGWNGAFGELEVTVSQDPDAFGAAQLVTTFTKQRSGQEALLELPMEGRYVRLVILSEVQGGVWASAADLGIIVD